MILVSKTDGRSSLALRFNEKYPKFTLPEWEAATVIAIVLILAFVLGASAHDGWPEGGAITRKEPGWTKALGGRDESEE